MKILILRMRLKLNQSKLFFLRLFRRFCEKCEEPQVEEQKAAETSKRKLKHLHSFDPATWTLKDMLESIDGTFDSLSYQDYRQANMFELTKQEKTMLRHIGPRLVTENGEVRINRLEFSQIFPLPAVSFVSFGRTVDTEERIYARFAYAIKHGKNYPHVELTRGALYRCGVAYEHRGKLLWVAFFVGISETGEVSALKSQVYDTHRVVGKTGRSIDIPTKTWRIQGLDGWIDWMDAKDLGEAIERLAATTINMAMMAEWHWQVVVSKGKHKITVPVPQNEAKRFFKERDIEENGKRKAIYHLVASHHRRLKTGKIVPVRPHSRGQRKFLWKGYQINIIEPGKHINFLSSFGAEAIKADEKGEFPNGYIPIAAGGKRIGQAMQND